MDELWWQVLLEATFEWRFRIYRVPLMHHPCVLVYKMHNKASQGILSHLSLNTDTKSGQVQHILFFLLCPWPPRTLWPMALWDLHGLVPASGKSMFPVTSCPLWVGVGFMCRNKLQRFQSTKNATFLFVWSLIVFFYLYLYKMNKQIYWWTKCSYVMSTCMQVALRRLTLLPVALLPRLLQFSCSSISSLWEATPEGQWWTRTSWPPTEWKPFLWWLHTWEIRIFKYQHKFHFTNVFWQ